MVLVRRLFLVSPANSQQNGTTNVFGLDMHNKTPLALGLLGKL